MFITGAAKPNVVVLIARIVIQIERKRTGVGCIIPIAATEEHPTALVKTFPASMLPPSSNQKAFGPIR